MKRTTMNQTTIMSGEYRWRLYEVTFTQIDGELDSYSYDLIGEINYKEADKLVLFDGTNWIETIENYFQMNIESGEYHRAKGVSVIRDKIIAFEAENELFVTPML